MLSPKVDLTEHMDFNRGSMNIFSNTRLVEISDDEQDLMSTEEYEWFTWWEGIFGKKRHVNQKWDIFPRLTLDVAEDPNASCCVRCGKVIRIPWKNYRHRYPWGNCELCFECNEKVETETWDKIPWNRNMNNFPSRSDEKGYNLFNSR